jgi:hypothetical protein
LAGKEQGGSERRVAMAVAMAMKDKEAVAMAMKDKEAVTMGI